MDAIFLKFSFLAEGLPHLLAKISFSPKAVTVHSPIRLGIVTWVSLPLYLVRQSVPSSRLLYDHSFFISAALNGSFSNSFSRSFSLSSGEKCLFSQSIKKALHWDAPALMEWSKKSDLTLLFVIFFASANSCIAYARSLRKISGSSFFF